MITRRSFGKILGATLVATSTGIIDAQRANAQTDNSLERIKSSGILRIGGIADGAPYYQKSLTGGPWRGFYIDICQKLADDLGVRLSILETTWGNSVLDLQSGKTDVFFGLNPTPQRQQVIDFSVPVFKNAFSLVAKQSVHAKTWADFNTSNMRISVDAGSSHDAIVSRLTPNASISRLKTASDATAALQSGRVDAQCLVIILALALRVKNPRIGQLIIPTPVNFTTSNAGFRREEDSSWRTFVDAWVSEHRDNGFIKSTIVRNMELVGVYQSDFPDGFEI